MSKLVTLLFLLLFALAIFYILSAIAEATKQFFRKILIPALKVVLFIVIIKMFMPYQYYEPVINIKSTIMVDSLNFAEKTNRNFDI